MLPGIVVGVDGDGKIAVGYYVPDTYGCGINNFL